MQSDKGAGRNLFSICCCNYQLLKVVASPFLNSVGHCQDMAETTSECVQNSRLSCTDFLSSANLSALPQEDLESGIVSTLKKNDDHRRSRGKNSFITNCWNGCLATFTSATAGRFVHFFGFIVSVGIIFIFLYASFTV
jgi:hypothetical protein